MKVVKVAHPSMLLHYLIPTRDSIKINQRNLEQDILLEIEVTVKAEDDLGLFVCPVCHNRIGMCQESRCKRPSLKAAKCHLVFRESVLPLLRFEFAEAAVQPQDNLSVCARLRLIDEASAVVVLDGVIAPTRVSLLQKLP